MNSYLSLHSSSPKPSFGGVGRISLISNSLGAAISTHGLIRIIVDLDRPIMRVAHHGRHQEERSDGADCPDSHLRRIQFPATYPSRNRTITLGEAGYSGPPPQLSHYGFLLNISAADVKNKLATYSPVNGCSGSASGAKPSPKSPANCHTNVQHIELNSFRSRWDGIG